jgi:putative hemolysin
VTLGLRLAEWGLPVGVAETLGVGFVLAVIAYFSLVIGELVPKQIALRNPEAIAVKVAPAMTVIAAMASPIVWLLDASGRAVLRTFGLKSEPGDSHGCPSGPGRMRLPKVRRRTC